MYINKIKFHDLRENYSSAERIALHILCLTRRKKMQANQVASYSLLFRPAVEISNEVLLVVSLASHCLCNHDSDWAKYPTPWVAEHEASKSLTTNPAKAPLVTNLNQFHHISHPQNQSHFISQSPYHFHLGLPTAQLA